MAQESLQSILARARQRAADMKLPYAGALLPDEAQAVLAQVPEARLVDVRTRAEWEWVGRIPQAVEVEWNGWPGGQRNPEFLQQLAAQLPPSEAPVLFLCRSGGRSHSAAAAAAQAGYPNSFNILEGFEGDKDAQGHRNSVGGWRAKGLPWSQS